MCRLPLRSLPITPQSSRIIHRLSLCYQAAGQSVRDRLCGLECAGPGDMDSVLIRSVQYAVHSHPKLHDAVLSPQQIDEAIIPLSPRQGEDTLRTEDILKVLQENRETVSEEPSSPAEFCRSPSSGSHWCNTTLASCWTSPLSQPSRTRLARSSASTWRMGSGTSSAGSTSGMWTLRCGALTSE
jgi:hypothetical protein